MSNEKGPSPSALRAFPVSCGTCAAEPGSGCQNQWGRKVHYQHASRLRKREAFRKASGVSS